MCVKAYGTNAWWPPTARRSALVASVCRPRVTRSHLLASHARLVVRVLQPLKDVAAVVVVEAALVVVDVDAVAVVEVVEVVEEPNKELLPE